MIKIPHNPLATTTTPKTAITAIYNLRSHTLLSHDARLIILASAQREELLQFPLQRLERRSLVLVALPALVHDVVERLRAARGWGHAVAVLHLVKDLGVCHAC